MDLGGQADEAEDLGVGQVDDVDLGCSQAGEALGFDQGLRNDASWAEQAANFSTQVPSALEFVDEFRGFGLGHAVEVRLRDRLSRWSHAPHPFPFPAAPTRFFLAPASGWRDVGPERTTDVGRSGYSGRGGCLGSAQPSTM